MCHVLQVLQARKDGSAGIGQGLFLAGQDPHGAVGHGLLFHFAGIGSHGGDPAAGFLYAVFYFGEAEQAPGQDDGVHLAVQDGGHGPDGLGDLVDHGLPDGLHDLVTGFQPLVELGGIRGAEPAGQAPALGTQGADFGRVVVPEVVQHVGHGHGPHTGGGEGALAAAGVVAVDHAAVVVGGDGDAAVYMADDEAAVLITLAQGLGVFAGYGLEVESVGDGPAVYAAHAGDAGQGLELVHDGRVHHEQAAAVAAAVDLGHLHAQHGGVVEAPAGGPGVVYEALVYVVDAARDGVAAAAPAHDGIHALQAYAVVGQIGVHDLDAEIQLVVDGGKFAQLRGIVEDVHVEDLAVVLKEGEFRGGGAGVDDEYLKMVFCHDLAPVSQICWSA